MKSTDELRRKCVTAGSSVRSYSFFVPFFEALLGASFLFLVPWLFAWKSVRLSVCLQYSLKVYWFQSLFFTTSRRLYTREAGFLYLSLDLWLLSYIYGETRAPLQETCRCKNFNILWIWSQRRCSVMYTCIFLNLNQRLLIANWNNSLWILVWRCSFISRGRHYGCKCTK